MLVGVAEECGVALRNRGHHGLGGNGADAGMTK